MHFSCIIFTINAAVNRKATDMRNIISVSPGLLLIPVFLYAGVIPSLLTPDEAGGIESVVSAALKAGFPDSAESRVYEGTIKVSAAFNPSEGMRLPGSASRMQQFGSERTIYNFEFAGLHFALPDGTWVIADRYHFKPGEGDKVDVSGAKAVNLDGLADVAAEEAPFDAEKNASSYLAGIAPEQRERTKEAMNRFVPVLNTLKLSSDELIPATLLLYRAGWPEAGALSLIIADQRARNFWILRPWTVSDPEFDPTGKYPDSDAEESAWEKAHPVFTPEPPQTALRRGLFRWFRTQMAAPWPEDAMISLQAAAAGARAMVDPGDPQGNTSRVDALLAGMQLPAEPEEGADLAGRLQSWELRKRMPRIVVQGKRTGNTASGSTAFVAPAAAYTPVESDLDALIGLLADERPSRFQDFSGPRTVGDNAWRAAAILLKEDPRQLAGYPSDRPWIPAERRAAATAVGRWWKNHRSEYIDK
jgi:hypothetical protein